MKKSHLTICLIVGLLVVVFLIDRSNHMLYGNDKASIVKVIHSIDGYEDQPIEILGIKDFKDVRLVGFLYNDSPAYIEFDKTKGGNYKWSQIEVKHDETLSSFFIVLPNNISPKLMYVSSHQNKTTKMQVDVNGQKLEQHFPTKASITWVDLPQPDHKGYTFRNYKFYDTEGNLIKDRSD